MSIWPGGVDRAPVDAGDPRAQRDLDLRILRLDRRVELRDALAVARALLLVADLDVLQRKRRRVPVLRRARAPHVDVAGPIAYSMASSVSWISAGSSLVRQERAAAERARHADVHDPQRVGADVLGELQELVIPEAVRAPVAPRAVRARPRLDRPDRSLPLRPALDRDAFGEAAAGPANEPGLQVARRICARSGRRPFGRSLNVFAGKSETMSSQTRPAARNDSAEPRLRIRRGRARASPRTCASRPAATRDGSRRRAARAVGRLERARSAARDAVGTREEAETVLVARRDRHAPVARRSRASGPCRPAGTSAIVTCSECGVASFSGRSTTRSIAPAPPPA